MNIIFLKIHSALTIALTENLHEYKIVERKMAHLFYLGKVYLALLVYVLQFCIYANFLSVQSLRHYEFFKK